MMYLAIDPGVVSGVAVYHAGGLYTDELADIGETAAFVDRVVSDAYPQRVTIVTEKFIISARTIKTKVKYESLYFNGWLSIEYPDSLEQTAAQAKKFATDDKLKHLGWFTPTKDGHANDAARHLLYRATKDRVPWVIEKLQELT